MSVKLNILRKLVRELIKRELEEATMTGNIDGGAGPPKTPKAFKKKKKGQDESGFQDGHGDPTVSTSYRKVKESVNESRVSVAKEGKLEPFAKAAIKQLQNLISFHKKGKNEKARQMSRDVYTELEYMGMAFRVLGESINEGKYHDYRNDETLTPKQKIGYSMREVRDKLNELDKLVKMNVRLKNEIGVDSTSYWKRTHGAMKKISERLVKLANKVGQLY